MFPNRLAPSVPNNIPGNLPFVILFSFSVIWIKPFINASFFCYVLSLLFVNHKLFLYEFLHFIMLLLSTKETTWLYLDSRVFHNFIFLIELLAKTLQRFGICLAVNNRLYRKLVSPVPIMFYDNLMFMIELHQLHFLPYPLIYPAQNLITWGLNCDIQSFYNNTKKLS